jgi:hypothetical protein
VLGDVAVEVDLDPEDRPGGVEGLLGLSLCPVWEVCGPIPDGSQRRPAGEVLQPALSLSRFSRKTLARRSKQVGSGRVSYSLRDRRRGSGVAQRAPQRPVSFKA